jgi:hypothetical protein
LLLLELEADELELSEALELPEATEPVQAESLELLELPLLPELLELPLLEVLEQPVPPALMPSRRAVPDAPLS